MPIKLEQINARAEPVRRPRGYVAVASKNSVNSVKHNSHCSTPSSVRRRPSRSISRPTVPSVCSVSTTHGRPLALQSVNHMLRQCSLTRGP